MTIWRITELASGTAHMIEAKRPLDWPAIEAFAAKYYKCDPARVGHQTSPNGGELLTVDNWPMARIEEVRNGWRT